MIYARFLGPNDDGNNSLRVKILLISFSFPTIIGISNEANSLILCLQPPHGVHNRSPYPITAIAFIFVPLDATIAAIAEASAQLPIGYAAFSILHPT